MALRRGKTIMVQCMLVREAGLTSAMQSTLTKSDLDKLLQSVNVLIVDGNQFMRKTVRTLLMNIGVKNVRDPLTAFPVSNIFACSNLIS